MKMITTKHSFILLFILFFSTTVRSETLGAYSVEWLTSASDFVAVGKIRKLRETKGEHSVIYESYVLQTTEVIKGKKKSREIEFVNRSLSDYDSLKNLAQAEIQVLVFLVYYQEKDTEKFLHDKLVPTNKSFPSSVISLDNPTDKFILDAKFNNLMKREKILEVCRKTTNDLKKFLKKNPLFKLESRVIEPNFVSNWVQYLIVPNFMFPNAKKSIFELYQRND